MSMITAYFYTTGGRITGTRTGNELSVRADVEASDSSAVIQEGGEIGGVENFYVNDSAELTPKVELTTLIYDEIVTVGEDLEILGLPQGTTVTMPDSTRQLVNSGSVVMTIAEAGEYSFTVDHPAYIKEQFTVLTDPLGDAPPDENLLGVTPADVAADNIPGDGEVLAYVALTESFEWQIKGGAWGSISGTLADQTDLQNVLNTKLESESDPVFLASPAAGITAIQIGEWNTAVTWGNHADAGYLTSVSWADVALKPATATRWPAFSEVTSVPVTASRWPTWSEVTSKPATFTPSAHDHVNATAQADGFMSAGDFTKLGGIEAGATADQSAAEILTTIKTVDGAGSGLDADLLDGFQPGTTAAADTVALRDGGGNLYMNYAMTSYVNMSHAAGIRNNDTVFYSSTDNYIRKTTAAGMRSSLNVPTRTGDGASGNWNIDITGNAASADNATTVGGAQRTHLVQGINAARTTTSTNLQGEVCGFLEISPTDSVNIGLNNTWHWGLNCRHNNLAGEWGWQMLDRNSTTPVVQVRSFSSGTYGSWYTMDVTLSSDQRVKKDGVVIEDALGKIASMQAVEFTWRDDLADIGFVPPEGIDRDVGLYAQEVQEVFPAAVHEAGFNPDYLAVDYKRIVPLLVKAVQELQAEIKELKSNNPRANK